MNISFKNSFLTDVQIISRSSVWTVELKWIINQLFYQIKNRWKRNERNIYEISKEKRKPLMAVYSLTGSITLFIDFGKYSPNIIRYSIPIMIISHLERNKNKSLELASKFNSYHGFFVIFYLNHDNIQLLSEDLIPTKYFENKKITA